MRQGNIVVYHHHADIETEGPRPFGGKTEIQPVAGIVLDDEKAARRSGDRQNTGKYSVNAGRGKNVATDGGRQHARTDKASMGRLMT